MSETDQDVERRQYPRIHLKAFGLDHFCIVTAAARGLRCRLVDISPTGARLRLLDPPFDWNPEQGEDVALAPALPGQPKAMAEIAADVRWAEGPDFGVRFLAVLPLAVRDLQDLLT